MLDWIGVLSSVAVITPSLHFLSFSSPRESMSTATATATTTTAFLPVRVAGTPLNKLKQAIQLPRLQTLSNTNNILVNNGQNRVTIASASSSTPTIEEEEDDPIPESTTSVRGCQGCGSEEKERGCNGEGRIQGGIATVPGFGWWPIKAYRPCPSYLATGGRYRRTGQSMDDIGFGGGGGGGGGGRKASATGEDAQMSKRKFKKMGSESATPRS